MPTFQPPILLPRRVAVTVAATLPARRYGAWLLLTLSSCLWAGNSTIGRALRDESGAIELSFWRWTVASLCLLPLLGREVWEKRALVRRHLPLFLAMAFTSGAPNNFLVFYGLHYTTALHTQLFNSTIPVWVMLLSWAVLRTPLSRGELAGLAVSMAGVLAIVAEGEIGRLLALQVNFGDLIVLGALFFWSVYMLLLKYRPAELSSSAFVLVVGGLSSFMMVPAWLWQVAHGGRLLPTEPGVIGGILYLSIASSLFAGVIHSIGVQRIGPARASLFTHLVPVFGAVFSALLIGEAFHLYHAAGFAMVLAGLWIANRTHPRYT